MDTPLPGEGYLIIHRGPARRNVVMLCPGEVMTIGRANANRIVIPDAKCSRHHCEISYEDEQWSVRDLGSRNGVLVDGVSIEGGHPLSPGEVMLIGTCEIEYADERPDGTFFEHRPDSTHSDSFDIIERASGTRYDKPNSLAKLGKDDEDVQHTKAGLAELYQLARAMAEAKTTASLAEQTLDGLFAGTSAKIGAVLLLPKSSHEPDPALLEEIAFKAVDSSSDRGASSYLSRLVFEEHEALLARDLAEQESLAMRDSIGKLKAQSAICTPVRLGKRLLGVLHLYTMDALNPLDSHDLEFALAVSDQFAIALEAVRDRESLEAGLSRVSGEAQSLRQQLEVETELVGNSEQMDMLRQKIGRVAPTDATVLVRGESGVGKELVACAVHFNSNRREGPFICLNCAALTESLLESELFGHEKGAFTGASDKKIGKFEQADEGTLFLDEVGEMNPEIQSKFLRVLEGHSFERVGGGKQIQVDVRVVTATNRNLEQAVQDGDFRQDLFYRLQVLEVFVPPLRQHPEDIETIAKHFLARVVAKTPIKVKGFTEDALEVLREYAWPGNVRELKNVVERSAILSDHIWLTSEDIRLLNLERPTPISSPAMRSELESTQVPFRPIIQNVDPWTRAANDGASLEQIEAKFISAALEHHAWNKSQTAKQLGIERTTLDRKIKKYELTQDVKD